jgi:hypothetical protein
LKSPYCRERSEAIRLRPCSSGMASFAQTEPKAFSLACIVIGAPSNATPSRIFGPSWACRNVGPAGSSPPIARGRATRRRARPTPRFEPSCAISPMRVGVSAAGAVRLWQRGECSGKNRIYRLYCEEGLTVRRRRARHRAVGARAPILVEAKPNARWPLDFVHDQFARGRRFRILNIVDDVTRECLAAIPDASISGGRASCRLIEKVPSRIVLKLADAASRQSRISDQAARSIG